MALKKMPGKGVGVGDSAASTPSLGAIKEMPSELASLPPMASIHLPPKRDKSPAGPIKTDDDQMRGRRPDKAAARVRVVGFEGKNQDVDEEEYVQQQQQQSFYLIHGLFIR